MKPFEWSWTAQNGGDFCTNPKMPVHVAKPLQICSHHYKPQNIYFCFSECRENIIRCCYFDKHTVWSRRLMLHTCMHWKNSIQFSNILYSVTCSKQYVYKSSSNLIYQLLLLWDPCFDGCYKVYSRLLFQDGDVLQYLWLSARILRGINWIIHLIHTLCELLERLPVIPSLDLWELAVCYRCLQFS